MSRKRHNTSSPELDDSPTAKRRPSPTLYEEDVVNSNEQPQLHPNSGQVNAFPGLGAEEGLFYGPAVDGIDYLRMVRSEAKAVPTILTAQDPPAQNQANETSLNGTYCDGTYIARGSTSDGTADLPRAQTRYYETLFAQFRVTQTTLRCTPPLETIQALGDLRPISFPSESATARRAWRRHINRLDPHPAQIACMDLESVFELIHLLGKDIQGLYKQSEKFRRRYGAWLWAAVGKCPDRGELGSEEIAQLRMLASKAAILLQSKDNVEESSEDEGDGVDDITSAIEAAMQAGRSIEDSVANGTTEAVLSNSTSMTIDMVLTIIGEVYGQRDLLDLRPRWAVEEIELSLDYE